MEKSDCVTCSQQLQLPMGLVTITFCEIGLHKVVLPSSPAEISCSQEARRSDTNSKQSTTASVITKWFQAYFSSGKTVDTYEKPALCGNAYNEKSVYAKIWEKLQETKVGETLTYADLSMKTFGHRRSARLVGAAMKRNPFPIVIPCHRVVKSTGKMGEFNSGVDNKSFLLEHEKRQM